MLEIEPGSFGKEVSAPNRRKDSPASPFCFVKPHSIMFAVLSSSSCLIPHPPLKRSSWMYSLLTSHL